MLIDSRNNEGLKYRISQNITFTYHVIEDNQDVGCQFWQSTCTVKINVYDVHVYMRPKDGHPRRASRREPSTRTRVRKPWLSADNDGHNARCTMGLKGGSDNPLLMLSCPVMLLEWTLSVAQFLNWLNIL